MGRVITPMIGRRSVLTGLTATGSALLLPGSAALAQKQLVRTPRQTEGPFYPVDWSGDIDHDLVAVTGEAAQAMGQVTHIRGRVLDLAGQPVVGAIVEIWQCDAKGIYRHPSDANASRRRDDGFQGRGRASTDASGTYTFRTIRPVAHPGRTPHIHFMVDPPRRTRLVTQMYVFGEPQNARDGVLNNIRDQRQRDSVVVRLDPADGIEAGALAGTFDIVVG
jgi:protocatechuate 3,4-dioxygenase beta subunit